MNKLINKQSISKWMLLLLTVTVFTACKKNFLDTARQGGYD